MWVVKLGGSLIRSPRLRDWLDLLAGEGGGRSVIVPGGGPFADTVRTEQQRSGFDDAAAHRMAILAMEQYGFLLASLEPRLRPAATEDELRGILSSGGVPVWLCYPMVIGSRDLPEDWSVSADSLALWLARRFGAEALVLVKSLPAPAGCWGELAAAGALDGYFPRLAAGYGGTVTWLHAAAGAEMKSGLASGRPPGLPLRGESGIPGAAAAPA